MSYLTMGPGGRIETDESTELGESGMEGIFGGLKKKLKKTFKPLGKAAKILNKFTPHKHVKRLKKLVEKVHKKGLEKVLHLPKPKLPGFGACRMCVVEVEGEEHPPISCSRAAEADMKVCP